MEFEQSFSPKNKLHKFDGMGLNGLSKLAMIFEISATRIKFPSLASTKVAWESDHKVALLAPGSSATLAQIMSN